MKVGGAGWSGVVGTPGITPMGMWPGIIPTDPSDPWERAESEEEEDKIR